jgi:Zn-dependent peptidase ImmA (M78 family)
MKPDVKLSSFAFVVESLGVIWNPGMEGLKLQRDLDVQSVDDIPFAAERAGFEISYVDLPAKVSGFPLVVAGKPHIVVNRAKPSNHTKFTIAHELGHLVLHFNPSHDADQAGLITNSMAEFQANMFATMLIVSVTNEEERDEMLKQNPEFQSTAAISIFVTFATIFVSLIAWVCSRLFQKQISASIRTK